MFYSQLSTPERRALEWFKSSYSNSQGNCFEVSVTGHGVYVRDSKEVAKVGPEKCQVLFFTYGEWKAAIRGIKDGELDIDQSLGVTPLSDWRRMESV